MKNRIILIALAPLMVFAGCKQNRTEVNTAYIDWDNNDKIEYVVDYTVSFASEHDSTMQVTVTSNYGTVDVVQIQSENLIGEDGKLVKNTFIVLEDSAPAGKSITLQRGGLSYTGEKPGYIHNNTIGSDDMVEIRIQDSGDYTLYSIRDNMFFGPSDEQSLTVGSGQHFSIILPVVTEEMYPKEKESRTIKIGFRIE